ncbi:hypothetical protein TRVA0_019S00782 [Trichomonascus vanleenenianus]|uniref:serine/threonine protein kinase ELM1 n=1 Tax=Trichomonascus vanleenenianus TaxID=2268995 RepID=UPI003EC98B1C
MSFSSLWKGDSSSKRSGSQSQPVSLSSSPTSPSPMPSPMPPSVTGDAATTLRHNGRPVIETHSHFHHLHPRAVNSRLHNLLHQSPSPSPGSGGFSSNPSLPIDQGARRISSYVKSPLESPVTAPPSPIGASLSQTSVKETHHISIDYDPVSGRKMLNTYEIIRELGRGQHGKVKLGRNLETGEYVAIKVVDRTGRPRLGKTAGSTQEDKIRREIAILKKCSHPNIVQLKEVLDDSTSKKIYLVLEYLEKGEVEWQTECGRPAMTRKMAKSTARDVLLGLEYLHFQGIIHRDIKPANLLLSADGRVKISDFGVSYVSTDGEDEFELAKTAGTPAFFAPELCVTSTDVPRPTITNKIDVWAFGVTLFCLLYGTVPFYADSEFELFDVIVNQNLVFPDEMSAEERKKFARNSATNRPLSIFYNPNDKHVHMPEPSTHKSANTNDTNDDELTTNDDTKRLNRRPSALLGPNSNDNIISVSNNEPAPALETDADLELAKDLIRKLLDKDPVTRITVIEAKQHPWLTDGMEPNDLERYLSASGVGCNDKIEVTGDDLQAAVQGITGKIKRGLSRFGSTALSFAGLRRRKSTSSTASSTTRKGRSISSTSAANSRSNSRDPFGHSPSDVPVISARHSVAGLPKRACDMPAPQPTAAHTAAAAAAAAATSSFVEYNPSLSRVVGGGNSSSSLHEHHKRGLPASSSNFNLNSLLEGEIDNTRRPSQTQLARSPLSHNHSRTSSMARSPGFSSSVVTSASSSISSSSSSSDDDDDDNGELTLVLGPPRGGLREPSPSSARLTRASESALRPPRLRYELTSPQASRESVKSPTSTLSADTATTTTNEDEQSSVTRFRSKSITVGILQRENDNV